jgi:hypothetical protein
MKKVQAKNHRRLKVLKVAGAGYRCRWNSVAQ